MAHGGDRCPVYLGVLYLRNARFGSAHLLGNLRAYVEALGGRLRLVADFGDDLIQIA